MKEFTIKRWDAVIVGNSIEKKPMVYIVPDIELLEFIRSNNYNLECSFTGTGSGYDDGVYKCEIDSSALTPNCRPNFFAESGLYCVTILTPWAGYPEQNGSIQFVNFMADTTPVLLVEDNIVIEGSAKDIEKKDVVEGFTKTKVQKRKRLASDGPKLRTGDSVTDKVTDIGNTIRDNSLVSFAVFLGAVVLIGAISRR